MTPTPDNQARTLHYSSSTRQRADRALRCSPFRLALFTQMRSTSVSLLSIAGQTGIEQGYIQKPLSEGAVERELMWLIQVGLLRREVDGQGITDSFRLTPLGRQLIEKWERQGSCLPQPSAIERMTSLLNQWFRLP